MHELHLLRPALEKAIERSRGTHPTAIRLTIHDPARISADAARFYATELLREQGIRAPVRVSVEWLSCALCAWAGIPPEMHPYCPACGAPLPASGRPAVTVRVDREHAARCA